MRNNDQRKTVAIASGKGGTGKTTVAVNLALTALNRNLSVAYADCDVEAPNGHIFLKPEIETSEPVEMLIPEVDQETCIACGKCEEICQYNAIVMIGEKVLVYPDLCHSCGGCMLVCPVGAISETPRPIGKVETGKSGQGLKIIQGNLNIGEKLAPPLIADVKAHLPGEGLVFLDAPPGTSCPVVETVSGADYTILVTEPTPFGLHDLTLAVGMMRALDQPFGVVLNRSDAGSGETLNYLESEQIPILAELPADRAVAEAYSRGLPTIEALPMFRKLYEELLKHILDRL